MASSPLPSSTPLFTPSSSSSSSTHQFLTNPFTLFLHPSKRPTHFTPKSSSDPNPEPESNPGSSSAEDPFDSRIDQIRLKYRSGTGKKAELRKTKKGKQKSGSGSTGSGLFLPPVELKEPVSEGLKVDFGFSPYSERVNGRIAGVGLMALLLVELATGKSVINYHTPTTVFIQVYFMAAVSAMFLKLEKEKVSVWPQSKQ
ncbi:Uncharacterized protein RDABS01_038194 [Bienertia sinuspersici]